MLCSNYLTFKGKQQIRFFLADFPAITPSSTRVQIKRGASAVCRSRNVGPRRSTAEQRDAPGEPEATLCCCRARELNVWQPCALGGHARTTAAVFSGHLHYSKINALSILCLPALDMCAASLLPQPKVGSPPSAKRHPRKLSQMSFLRGAELLNLAHCHCALDCDAGCR